jgi:hypothetical protein
MIQIKILLAVVAMTLALIFGLVRPATAQGAGTLEGQVVNGTAGGADAGAGIPVALRVVRDGVEMETLEATTDADGRFRFEGLDTDPGLEYWPEAIYLDVPYASPEPSRFGGDGTAVAATITVHQTTGDDSGISLDSAHIIVESFGEVLRISEIHIFSNSGDRTYIGSEGDAGQPSTVFIPLPDNAVGVAFGEGMPEGRFVQVGGGLVDTEPIPPGDEASLVFFSYHLMVPGETVPLERSFAYPLGTVNVLVAQPGLTLNSDAIQSMGPQNFQGRQYAFYATRDLAADTPLAMEFVVSAEGPSLSGSEGATAPAAMPPASGTASRGSQDLLLLLGFALTALAVVAAVIYPLATKPSSSAPTGEVDLAADPASRQLLSDLVDLEDSFEAGEVDEASYERQRTEKYEALKSSTS